MIKCVVAWQASWWYIVQADAVELVRISALKTFKALQTFVRFFTQIGTDIARHRCLPSDSALKSFKCLYRGGVEDLQFVDLKPKYTRLVVS